ncbi:unnamed protein product [Strongylus vulgaris]|uniref:Uncharacterized protein n=1 Tax=Strongylus vulgaris TaxID=40348 RepID=A0A3P7J054_STRVU|nr:unnamed protein product [Strongylus vulgaris]
MFVDRAGLNGAALGEWWHSLTAASPGEIDEFEPDSDQLIMDIEMEEMHPKRSSRREPFHFKNNRLVSFRKLN